MEIKALKGIKLKYLSIRAAQVSQMSEAGHVSPRGNGGIVSSLDLREHVPHTQIRQFLPNGIFNLVLF